MDSTSQPAIDAQQSTGQVAGQEALSANTVEIRRQILRLAGPAVVEYSLLSFTGIVNMIMVGSLGAEAIAAVGITNQPVFFVQATFMALSVGTTALIARAVGARQHEEASAIARQSMITTTLLALLVTVPQVFLARYIVQWMGAEPAVVSQATKYMQVLFLGTAVTVVPLSASAILRGAGDCKTPMALNVLTNVLNAIFGYALIYGHFGLPRLGVFGAGIGTVLARSVSAVLFVWRVYSPASVVPISLRESHRLDWKVISRIMRIGIPAAMEQFILRGGQTMFARTVASLGTLAYAAHQLTLNAESLAWNPPTAFQVAATTLTGQYLGAQDPQSAERAGYESLKMSLVLMVGVGSLCYVFAPQLMRMYTSDPVVIGMAVPNMRLFSMALPGLAIHMVLVGALRGAGDTRWPLYVSLVCVWLCRVMGSYVLAIRFGLGLRGAWMAMALDHCIRASITYARYRSGGWKHIRV